MDGIRVGVDIGGTFTDVALVYPGGLATAKVLTDYAAPEAAILDVGCGTGGNLQALASYGQVVGLDISPIAIEFARRRLWII